MKEDAIDTEAAEIAAVSVCLSHPLQRPVLEASPPAALSGFSGSSEYLTPQVGPALAPLDAIQFKKKHPSVVSVHPFKEVTSNSRVSGEQREQEAKQEIEDLSRIIKPGVFEPRNSSAEVIDQCVHQDSGTFVKPKFHPSLKISQHIIKKKTFLFIKCPAMFALHF